MPNRIDVDIWPTQLYVNFGSFVMGKSRHTLFKFSLYFSAVASQANNSWEDNCVDQTKIIQIALQKWEKYNFKQSSSYLTLFALIDKAEICTKQYYLNKI